MRAFDFRCIRGRNFLLAALFCAVLLAFSCSENDSVSNSSYNSNRIVGAPEEILPERKLSPNASLFERNLPLAIVLPSGDDLAAQRILKDYGAVFVARGDVVVPPKILFSDENDYESWRKSVATRKENFGGIALELQPEAMSALVAARDELRGKNLKISIRGTWGGSRSYRDTEKIWSTRVAPGLNYWTRRGKLSRPDAEKIRALAPAAQIAEILRLEDKKMFFSKDFSKSVLYSATPPGASQHLSMLAIDVVENGNFEVRKTLAKHGWFQTVLSDAPHFTYMGTTEDKLPSLGLKKIARENRAFWIPDF